nr:hypothetical protein [Tanacetum cinerariifolium]
CSSKDSSGRLTHTKQKKQLKVRYAFEHIRYMMRQMRRIGKE